VNGRSAAALARLQQDYRQATAHLAEAHQIHRGGTASQLVHWHALAHWLACTPAHDLLAAEESHP
jgi:hypothetical protein